MKCECVYKQKQPFTMHFLNILKYKYKHFMYNCLIHFKLNCFVSFQRFHHKRKNDYNLFPEYVKLQNKIMTQVFRRLFKYKQL